MQYRERKNSQKCTHTILMTYYRILNVNFMEHVIKLEHFFFNLGKLLMKDLYYFHYFCYIILQQLKGLKEYSYINHQDGRKTIYVPLLQKELKLVCD